ncbi:hypothetical protein XENORESO_012211 [Xenotaenia resolanae]|uniref:Uncharacterized protein n=1 Tax=Xenotaenia resolanae TaxID=208358 RepID=A0ABV0W5J6_9TELE
MLLPSVFLHSGFVPKPILIEGPSQQTDRAENLKQWIHQQGEEIKTRYGEDVEIKPFPIVLAEMEEVFGGSGLVLASPGYKPSQRSPLICLVCSGVFLLPPTASPSSAFRSSSHCRAIHASSIHCRAAHAGCVRGSSQYMQQVFHVPCICHRGTQKWEKGDL